ANVMTGATGQVIDVAMLAPARGPVAPAVPLPIPVDAARGGVPAISLSGVHWSGTAAGFTQPHDEGLGGGGFEGLPFDPTQLRQDNMTVPGQSPNASAGDPEWIPAAIPVQSNRPPLHDDASQAPKASPDSENAFTPFLSAAGLIGGWMIAQPKREER